MIPQVQSHVPVRLANQVFTGAEASILQATSNISRASWRGGRLINTHSPPRTTNSAQCHSASDVLY